MDDSTDLTTLTGKGNTFLTLVEKKFKFDDDGGNVTWGVIRHSTLNEFLDDYGDNGREKSLQRNWIKYHNLPPILDAPWHCQNTRALTNFPRIRVLWSLIGNYTVLIVR